MNRRWTVLPSVRVTCALALALGLSQLATLHAQQSTHPDVPDAPTPQAPAPMSDVKGVTPGLGTQSEPQPAPASNPTSSSAGTSEPQSAPPAPSAQAPVPNTPDDGPAPDLPAAGKGRDEVGILFRTYTNFVEVPVTVKDSKGQLVAGLDYRDFRVFENNVQQHISLFTVDPAALSVTYVIDQSVTADVMSKVNNSLGAIQGALTPYDDVSVFTYSNGAKEVTGFTGAQSHLLTAVLAITRATGREESIPVNSGPLAGCPITSNGACVDPNIQQGRSAGGADYMSIPKEIHTLNDAILRAAVALSTRPKGRRRIIYVVSDGKEYGSKASTKEVIKYLQTNKIAVYATVVGDSARWGEGYLSRFHIPFQMRDNVLPQYTQATGGSLYAEKSTNDMEKSYARLAEEARTQYTLGYISHQPAIDGKYRTIDVRVNRPNVDVTAKPGYYPTAQDAR
ncbi:VWA domain-containing protein [Acidicapsa ligni]|uniref:VWA domain-containing protein n=1 Tax=Acidicapsa ligni TaxID=542300 RepID=UPI0021E018B6|nr:VWA domain-containing protein [Acidicapsa ligni]